MRTYGNTKKDRELQLRDSYVARRKVSTVNSLSKASDGMDILLDPRLTPTEAVIQYLNATL